MTTFDSGWRDKLPMRKVRKHIKRVGGGSWMISLNTRPLNIDGSNFWTPGPVRVNVDREQYTNMCIESHQNAKYYIVTNMKYENLKLVCYGAASLIIWNTGNNLRQRPYHVEYTGSRLITAVKQHWAWLVLGWVTAWEHHVLLAFFFFFRSTLFPVLLISRIFNLVRNIFLSNAWKFIIF